MWLPFIDGDLLYRGPQQYFSSIVESQNYWWGRPEYPEKTTDLSQYIDKRYHLLLYQVHLAISGIGTHFSGDKRRMKGTTKHELRSLHFIKVKVAYHSYVNCIRPFIYGTYSLKIRRSVGSMSQVVGLPNNSFKPITNAAYVRARLCKLQKGALDLQPQVLMLISCLPVVGGSLRVIRLLPPLKLVAMLQLKDC